MTLLALQSVEVAESSRPVIEHSGPAGLFSFPDHWPAQGELLAWCQQIGPALAALMVLMGVVYLLFGFNIFRWLVMLNATIFGGLVGAAVGEKTGGAVPLAITGAFIFAVVTWPMMRWAVVITGAISGACIGVSMWRTFGLDPHFAWSGAGMGLIFFGLLTFIIFKSCVMTYMSLQGSAMLIFGLLALIFKYEGLTPQVHSWFRLKPFLLPMMVFIPTVLGVIYQQNTAAPPPAPPKKS